MGSSLASSTCALSLTFMPPTVAPRETEVSMLLAQGRTGTYIQEQLVLSQSTVKTYTRSIYRKLNVGDRQEMLDLIQLTKL